MTLCGWLLTTLPSSLPFHVPSSSLNDALLLEKFDCYLLPTILHSRTVSKHYLLHGNTQIPQHFSIPLKFFSASRMSALIWSMPSSMRSSCSNNLTFVRLELSWRQENSEKKIQIKRNNTNMKFTGKSKSLGVKQPKIARTVHQIIRMRYHGW